MKKNYLFLFMLAILAISCSKESLMDYGSNPNISEQISINAAAGAVITLSPSNADDTDALLDAFLAAKAAGPGSTVKLAAGEYHIGFILVEDFNGSFVGAGMGKTIIIPNLGLNNQPFYDQNLAPELLKFLRGNLKISGMSFLNPEGEPSEGDVLWAFLGLHDWAYNELPNPPEDHKITAVVDHVEFSSNPGSYSWSLYGVPQGIQCGPDFGWDVNLPYSNTDISVTYCSFTNMSLAYGNLGLDRGRTVFSNNKPVKTDTGISLTDNLGGTTLISGNEFYSNHCVVIVDYAYRCNEFKLSDGCQYEISGNTFHVTDGWGAITIANDRKGEDPPIIDPKNPVQVLIKNNLFDLKGYTWVGIWNWITDDAVISNNKFTGQAIAGIYVDERTTNSLMLGNNFSNLHFNGMEFWVPEASDGFKVLLFGDYNTIVGGDNSTTVLNMGDYNKISGAKVDNEDEFPLGQTIIDNYQVWKENLVKIRKH